jgi:hypothetical protein
LRVHGFDVPKFPVITPNDRETLKAMDKLFYHILYASAIEGKKYVRVYQKGCYRGAGDMWHLKDVLSPSLVEFIIEMGKVEIEDLLKM